jgi:hypothetical protein
LVSLKSAPDLLGARSGLAPLGLPLLRSFWRAPRRFQASHAEWEYFQTGSYASSIVEYHAASPGARLELCFQPDVSEVIEHAKQEFEIDPANKFGVLGRETVEWAIDHDDIACFETWLVTLVLELGDGRSPELGDIGFESHSLPDVLS